MRRSFLNYVMMISSLDHLEDCRLHKVSRRILEVCGTAATRDERAVRVGLGALRYYVIVHTNGRTGSSFLTFLSRPEPVMVNARFLHS